MIEQILQVHGIATLPWDHASIPTRIWAETVRLPSGCWKAAPHQADGFREVIVERITKKNPKDMWSITPTCANAQCVNPAHTCVVVGTVQSAKEKP